MAKKASTETNNTVVPDSSKFVFGKVNYQLMLIGLVVIIIGYALMSGTEDIMSSTKITVAPIVVLIGFAIEFVAILKKPSDR